MPDEPQPWKMGLGKLSDWANVCACGVMFFLFYQSQQNSFEIYRADKVEQRESLRRLWETTQQMQQDSTRQTELIRDMQRNMADMQRVNQDTLAELKRLKAQP